MNYLGLDYGLKHVGVALAAGPLAEPLTSVATDKAPRLIKDIADRYQVTHLVVGQPDVSLEPEFAQFLALLKTLNFAIQVVDETLSSHDSRQALLHTTPSRRRKNEHSVSAALILQSFLDNNLQT